jgi:hypothetical protein
MRNSARNVVPLLVKQQSAPMLSVTRRAVQVASGPKQKTLLRRSMESARPSRLFADIKGSTELMLACSPKTQPN